MRSWDRATAVPAARSEGFLIETVGDETVVYDTESKQAHCLKPLAALVFDSSDGHASVGEIARIAEERLGDPVSEADVANAVAQLESLGLLQTVVIVPTGDHLAVSNGNGVSRREMIRRVGFAGAAAAVGTSLVTTVVPQAAFAQSGIPVGCTGCTQNKDCTSNHCCQSVPGKSCNQSCCVGSNNSCHVTSCTCSISHADCTTTNCPGNAGTCNCTCTVCSTDTGCGACPCSTCPQGTVPCCTTGC
jgi:hypothetical protein